MGHTHQEQQLKEHFLHNYLSVCTIKLVRNCTNASCLTSDKTQSKNFCPSVLKQDVERKKMAKLFALHKNTKIWNFKKLKGWNISNRYIQIVT